MHRVLAESRKLHTLLALIRSSLCHSASCLHRSPSLEVLVSCLFLTQGPEMCGIFRNGFRYSARIYCETFWVSTLCGAVGFNSRPPSPPSWRPFPALMAPVSRQRKPSSCTSARPAAFCGWQHQAATLSDRLGSDEEFLQRPVGIP